MRIRKILISNFRSINSLEWHPHKNVNCLVGHGDIGKSTILDAIDWCLGAKRTLPVTDADFHQLDISNPIIIEITIGDLNDKLKTFDRYGLFLQGMNDDGTIEDEPISGAETVLTVRLLIEDDLDPQWSLLSQRAKDQEVVRNLSWGDRLQVAPTRIGAYASNHLSWNKTSLLNRISEEKIDNSAAFAEAARQARLSFGESAGDQLDETLEIVENAADELGVNYGAEITALLDANSVSFSGGNISLHDDQGISLKKMGLGSTRLLVAGLQKHVDKESNIILVDELEHGLEPHRISRFLTSLGTRDKKSNSQVFLTTHSPIVLRELSCDQLNIVRKSPSQYNILNVEDVDNLQGTIRHSAEAFFGTNVIICEGATEVGLIRGLDLFRSDQGLKTLTAAGTVLVDAGGVTKIYNCASSFQHLKYKVSTLRDDDVKPKEVEEKAFTENNGMVFKWSEGLSIEQELFSCVTKETAIKLLDVAIELHGEELVHDHITSAEKSAVNMEEWKEDLREDRQDTLGDAAKLGGWFKRISIMEDVARYIIAPDIENSHKDLRSVVRAIYDWVGVDDE